MDTRERCVPVVVKHREDDERQSCHRKHIVASMRPSCGQEGANRPCEKFPCARRREKEVRTGMVSRPILAPKQAECGDCDDERKDASATELPEGKQQQRKEKIILLFNRETPGMKQRLQLCCRIEISALAPEQDIG